MSEQSATAFLKKKHPTLLAVLEVIMHRITTTLILILLGGGITFNGCKHSQLEKKVQGMATVQTNIIQYIAPE